MSLSVYSPEPGEKSPKRSPRMAASPPLPLYYHDAEHRDDAGPYVDTTMAWAPAEAKRCRHCAAADCTLQAAGPDLAFCTVRRRGTLARPVGVSLPGE